MSRSNVSDATDAVVQAMQRAIQNSGLSVETVAVAAGVPPERLQQDLAGVRSPYVSDLMKVGAVLGVSASEWFRDAADAL